jgi:hypothetical protein
MTNKEMKIRINKLEKIIQDTFWMARRYAHGRHTYTPSIIRENYNLIKELGNIPVAHDATINPPMYNDLSEGANFREDWLDDINEDINMNREDIK